MALQVGIVGGGQLARMMIAPVIFFGEATLAVNGSTEFAAPNDEGVFEHAAGF